METQKYTNKPYFTIEYTFNGVWIIVDNHQKGVGTSLVLEKVYEEVGKYFSEIREAASYK